MRAALLKGWEQVMGSGERLTARLPGRAAIRDGARYLRGGLADLVFPRVCVSCGAELCEPTAVEKELLICENCLDEMELFAEPLCERCGIPVPAVQMDDGVMRRISTEPGCYRCRGPKLWFHGTVALGLYSGRVRELVLRMKSADGDAVSLALGRLLWQRRGAMLVALGADVVVP